MGRLCRTVHGDGLTVLAAKSQVSNESPTMASTPASTGVMDVFNDYADYITAEQQIREDVRMRLRECEQSCRELNAVLQKIHTSGGIEKIPQLIKEIRGIFERSVRPQVAALFEAVPGGQPSQYYRYHHVFNFTLQRLVFFAAMAHYLEKEEILLKAPAAKEWLGIEPEADNQNGKPHLDLEDYLNGLIQMSNELARFSVNCVTQGDYERPLRIPAFVGDLLTGFRLLNLKNDGLRKKFDSLKYDAKKPEEVVYDLSIRGLVKKQAENGGGGGDGGEGKKTE